MPPISVWPQCPYDPQTLIWPWCRPRLWVSRLPSVAIGATDINIETGCCRTIDPDIALGGSPGQTSWRTWLALQASWMARPWEASRTLMSADSSQPSTLQICFSSQHINISASYSTCLKEGVEIKLNIKERNWSHISKNKCSIWVIYINNIIIIIIIIIIIYGETKSPKIY